MIVIIFMSDEEYGKHRPPFSDLLHVWLQSVQICIEIVLVEVSPSTAPR